MINIDLDTMEESEFLGYLLRFEVIFQNQAKPKEMASLIDEFMEKNSEGLNEKGNLLLIKAFYLEMGKDYEKALEIYERLGNYIACARVLRALGRTEAALRYEEKEREEKSRYLRNWCL